MTRALFCPACQQPFELADDAEATCLVCPHCAGRVVNLRALRSVRWEGLSCLGILLGSAGGGLAGLFLLCGIPAAVLIDPTGRWISPVAMSLLWALAAAFLYLSGVLFVRAADRTEGRGMKLLAAVFALLASTTLFIMLTLAMSA